MSVLSVILIRNVLQLLRCNSLCLLVPGTCFTGGETHELHGNGGRDGPFGDRFRRRVPRADRSDVCHLRDAHRQQGTPVVFGLQRREPLDHNFSGRNKI